MTTQTIRVSDELANFALQEVSRGSYASVSEVYREALRRLRDEQQKDALVECLEAELEKGLSDSDAGRVTELRSLEEHAAFFAEIQREGTHA